MSDLLIAQTINDLNREGGRKHANDLVERLMANTGACEKVVYAALERACDNRVVEYGVSLRCCFLWEKGFELLVRAGVDIVLPFPSYADMVEEARERVAKENSK